MDLTPAILVEPSDPRFAYLLRGYNARFPSVANAAGRIVLCADAADVAGAVERSVRAGIRPTVRSGGHCYENFAADNPGGDLIDLSLLNDVAPLPSGGFRISAGARLGEVYDALYKRGGVTLPGGSCPAVGAGGHICGGGYGLLSRLQGLTVDWLSAVEIATVNAGGKVDLRRVDAGHDPDLFRACRGAGGGNFGVITQYEFDRLPAAPRAMTTASLSFDWAAMTPGRFHRLLRAFGDYWDTRGREEDTWGLFAILVLSHQSAGNLSLAAYLHHDPGDSTRVLDEFMERFDACGPMTSAPEHAMAGDAARAARRRPTTARSNDGPLPCGPPAFRERFWMEATERATPPLRYKYGSAYMKQSFSAAEAASLYKHLTRWMPGVDLSETHVQVDSYGGRVNAAARREDTSAWARGSIMKLQWKATWTDPGQDAGHLQWKRESYADVYSGPDADPAHKGTPYPNDHYEGCYINYPDVDMLAYTWWPELYYGTGDLVPFLQAVKRRYDPRNVFHHALSPLRAAAMPRAEGEAARGG